MPLNQLREMSASSVSGAALPLSITSRRAGRRLSTRTLPAPTSHLDHSLHGAAELFFPQAGLPVAQDRTKTQWEEVAIAMHFLPTNSVGYRIYKRLLDLVVVLALLPILVPLGALVALLVASSSAGPILYCQQRIGRFGKKFCMWKFRSMHVHGDEILASYLEQNPVAAKEWLHSQKLKDDPRVTSIGRLLRRSSLDELPQFLNVLFGSMSLVGPRPIVESEVERYRENYLFYTSATPGLSGLWQVSGRSNVSYDERVQLDKNYVCDWTLGLDLRILWRTAIAVWRKQGAH